MDQADSDFDNKPIDLNLRREKLEFSKYFNLCNKNLLFVLTAGFEFDAGFELCAAFDEFFEFPFEFEPGIFG